MSVFFPLFVFLITARRFVASDIWNSGMAFYLTSKRGAGVEMCVAVDLL
jgi:hypothetical protein